MVRTLLKDSFNFLKRFRIDIRKDCLEIHPAVHYTLGGLHINERGETSVQRLFAAGENSSNVHGANRVSGNALAETQVFGTIAGKNASDLAKKNRYPAFSKAAAKKAVCELNYFMEKKKDSVRALDLRKDLKKVMDRYVGLNRNEHGLITCLQKILDIKNNGLPKVQVSRGRIFNVDWLIAIELSMSLILAEAVVRSALFRKNSLGHHFRSDFPKKPKTPKHTCAVMLQESVIVMDKPVKQNFNLSSGL
jgi:succinate dehydrogenase/fumarate reductase flavoprotein subunit